MSENLLLACLPKEERERLDPFLEVEELDFMQNLIEPNEPIRQIYFPFDAITSTLQEMEDGSSIETGLMGIEGVIGIQFWLGAETTPTKTFVQVGGRSHRMSAEDFKREVMHQPFSPLNQLIGKYVHAFLTMTSQVAACNRLHTIDQRLCRWLKLVHNRVRRDDFQIRHDFMAHMLGVARPTVSTAAAMLQVAGFIKYSRGNMKILDPEGLREGACECLEIMEVQFDRIFGKSWRNLAEQEYKKKAAQQ